MLAVYLTKLYISGSFTEILGQERQNFATIDITTNSLLNFKLNFYTGFTLTMFSTGNTLLIGGIFLFINDKLKPYFATINANTGNIIE
jgi:hypothetical protein